MMIPIEYGFSRALKTNHVDLSSKELQRALRPFKAEVMSFEAWFLQFSGPSYPAVNQSLEGNGIFRGFEPIAEFGETKDMS